MPKSQKHQVIIAYVPVLHRGYVQFFDAFKSAQAIYLVNKATLSQLDYLRKDLRALEISQVKTLLSGLGRFKTIETLDAPTIKRLDSPDIELILPDDDISHIIAKKFSRAKKTYFPIFLRWDRRALEHIDEDDSAKAMPVSDFEKKIMKEALMAASQSSDLWRRVGAVLILPQGQTRHASNQGEPTPYSPWIEGDPRNVFNRGIAIEMSVFMHAEANLISEAARAGVRLLGASLYVTTFPCPACAKLIAHSGIQKLYYGSGYAVLDGRRIMDEYGVEIIRVNTGKQDTENPAVWVPYKK